MMDTITKIELAKWHEDTTLPDTAKAKLFGELVQRAMPILEQYHSDLYHDVRFIEQYVNEPGTFYYALNSTGTAVGYESKYIFPHRTTLQLQVTITHEYRVWYVTIVDMTEH